MELIKAVKSNEDNNYFKSFQVRMILSLFDVNYFISEIYIKSYTNVELNYIMYNSVSQIKYPFHWLRFNPESIMSTAQVQTIFHRFGNSSVTRYNT